MNVTGQQFMFDLDGTVFKNINSSRSVLSTYTTNDKNMMTGYNSTGVTIGASSTYWNFLFPQSRTITDFTLATNYGAAPPSLWYSADTTNGSDGTWIDSSIDLTVYCNATENVVRSSINHVNFVNITGVEIRATAGYNLRCAWFYGTYSHTGLQFWHPTNNVPLENSDFDWGDVTLSGVYTKTFRIKNNSAQTANDTVIAATTPSVGGTVGGIEFDDGGGYGPNVTISALTTGQISSVITMRRTVSMGESQGTIGRCRISATPTSWT